ncbi:MAG: cysteine desulfurase [Chloroflexi bacterium]|nr:cysteine desulfurase [Chloroflexota bacterium]
MSYDVAAVRRDFPILSRVVHGKPLVYLDNAATSQKPRQVIDALVKYYTEYNANIHRGVYLLSQEATEVYEQAREKVAKFINSPGFESIIFTRNTTEAINLVAYAWGRGNISAGDEIVLSGMEHHSNMVPWQLLAKERGATLRFVEVLDDGTLNIEQLYSLINGRTKLVAMTQMSNVLGTITPVEEIVRAAHDQGALCLIDGAQSAAHLPVDVQQLGCDFFAFSAHKMLGPTGVGVLYGRRELLEEMPPFLGGGDMIMSVSLREATWNDLPYKFEAGTPNIADVIAFGEAVDYLARLGMKNVRQHEKELTAYALAALGELGPDIRIFGPRHAEQKGGVISFEYGGIHPHDLGTALDYEGVAIRAGHHCAQPLMERLGVPATARASFYLYNTKEEVDVLVSALKKARAYFGDAVRTA